MPKQSDPFSVEKPLPSSVSAVTKRFVGRWNIRATSEWDYDYLSLVERPELEISSGGQGTIRFGAFNAELDAMKDEWRPSDAMRFTFFGEDEGDEVFGRGCDVIENGLMPGRIAFYQGMVSNFEAEKLQDGDR